MNSRHPRRPLLFTAPVSFQHRVHGVINKVVIKPFCITNDTFLREAETFRNCPTPAVPDCGRNLDSVKTVHVKSM